jgi:hypothetical protein
MEPANTLDVLTLKAIIKESVREVMREEWFKFFEMLIHYYSLNNPLNRQNPNSKNTICY